MSKVTKLYGYRREETQHMANEDIWVENNGYVKSGTKKGKRSEHFEKESMSADAI